MDVIVLLKNFAYLGEALSSFSTEWIQFPAGYKNAQLVVIVKSRIGSAVVTIQLQTSWDTDTILNVGSSTSTGAPGTQVTDITSNLGPMVRLNLSSASTAQAIISVYLTPKSE